MLTVGDRISLVNKDGSITDGYYINSTITYNGGFEEQTNYTYSDSELETANNPTSLGEVLNQTSAKVDKVNKEIALLVDNVSKLSQFVVDENGITATVLEKVDGKNYATKDEIPNVDELEERLTSAEAKLEEDALSLTFGEYIDKNGIGKEIVTETNYKFNKDGLVVAKANSEMKTTITEDGMVVYRDNKAMLTANNQGVDAVNLKASTYLVIGKNSRFEDYGSTRTGCFWIGE